MSQRNFILLELDQFRDRRPTLQWCCKECFVSANNSVKNVSATLFFLQRICNKCL